MSRYGKVILFVLVVVFAACAANGETRSMSVADSALNMSPLYGPEGLVMAPDGSLYIGEHDGRIRRVASDGKVEEFADLNDFPGEREEEISAIGLAMDKEGDIYAATLTALDGAVIKIVGPGKPDAGKLSLFRSGINSANFILVDDESGMMYVSDSSMLSGGVFRFDMNDESLIGSAADPEKDSLGKYSYANGLVLGLEKKWIYVAETVKGRVSRINLADGSSEVFAETGGWADGLAYDAERKLFFVCDNKGGKIVAVDLSGKIAGERHIVGKEGQCAPACILLKADTIIFTDLWKASLWAALVGKPEYHSYVYEVPIAEILK
jgi:sugar lactone lactonase YvrE